MVSFIRKGVGYVVRVELLSRPDVSLEIGLSRLVTYHLRRVPEFHLSLMDPQQAVYATDEVLSHFSSLFSVKTS